MQLPHSAEDGSSSKPILTQSVVAAQQHKALGVAPKYAPHIESV